MGNFTPHVRPTVRFFGTPQVIGRAPHERLPAPRGSDSGQQSSQHTAPDPQHGRAIQRSACRSGPCDGSSKRVRHARPRLIDSVPGGNGTPASTGAATCTDAPKVSAVAVAARRSCPGRAMTNWPHPRTTSPSECALVSMEVTRPAPVTCSCFSRRSPSCGGMKVTLNCPRLTLPDGARRWERYREPGVPGGTPPSAPLRRGRREGRRTPLGRGGQDRITPL
jgi:hypothetical protein